MLHVKWGLLLAVLTVLRVLTSISFRATVLSAKILVPKISTLQDLTGRVDHAWNDTVENDLTVRVKHERGDISDHTTATTITPEPTTTSAIALRFKSNKIQANLTVNPPTEDKMKDDPCPHCGPDQEMKDIAGLCSRSGPGHWLKCRAALADELGLGNITCPEACVTFERFGRFNNNIIQIVNLIMNFIHPFSSKKEISKSIVLPDFLKPYFTNYAFDFDQLEKVCVFPSWGISGRPQRVGKCQIIDAESTYFGIGGIHPRGSRHVLYNQLISWLLVGAVSGTTRRQVDAQLADFGEDFSALHARFLEGECTSALCQMNGAYIEAEMKKLGHSTEVFVVCTDHQRQDLVIPVIAHMNGTLITDRYRDLANSVITSNYLLSLIGQQRTRLRYDAPSPVFDLLVMIHAKRFLGNKMSSMAGNIQRVRTTIFGNVTGVTI
jgi:hypothetical protein